MPRHAPAGVPDTPMIDVHQSSNQPVRQPVQEAPPWAGYQLCPSLHATPALATTSLPALFCSTSRALQGNDQTVLATGCSPGWSRLSCTHSSTAVADAVQVQSSGFKEHASACMTQLQESEAFHRFVINQHTADYPAQLQGSLTPPQHASTIRGFNMMMMKQQQSTPRPPLPDTPCATPNQQQNPVSQTSTNNHTKPLRSRSNPHHCCYCCPPCRC